MNDIQKRVLLFLFGCIGLRSYLVYLAKTLSDNYLQIMGFISLIPAIGFMYIFLTGSRQTGAEVFGDKIWWNNLRPVHSFLYFCFAYFAINKVNTIAWKFLLADVILGFTAFSIHHYKAGSKIFSLS
jgi:hypothetical protein